MDIFFLCIKFLLLLGAMNGDIGTVAAPANQPVACNISITDKILNVACNISLIDMNLNETMANEKVDTVNSTGGNSEKGPRPPKAFVFALLASSIGILTVVFVVSLTFCCPDKDKNRKRPPQININD